MNCANPKCSNVVPPKAKKASKPKMYCGNKCYQKHHYELNKDHIIKKSVQWQKDNKGRYLERLNLWKANNIERVRELGLKHSSKHYKRRGGYKSIAAYRREYNKKKVDNLSVDYIKQCITQKCDLLRSDINMPMVELRKALIILDRKIKQSQL